MHTGLTAAALLVIASSSFAQGKPAKPPTTTTIASPTLVDTTGTAVGLYQAPGYALFRLNGVALTIAMQRDGGGASTHSSRVVYGPQESYFVSADCSGPATPIFRTYIYPPSGGSEIAGTRAVAYARAPSGQITAYIAAPGVSTPRTVNSRQNTNGTCEVFAGGMLNYGFDVEATVILPTGPFTVE